MEMKIKYKKVTIGFETIYCVRHPDRKAKIHGGHVIIQGSKRTVLAGWCSKRCVGKLGFCGWIEK